MEAIFKRSGVVKAHPHCFRHTLASELLGKDEYVQRVIDIAVETTSVPPRAPEGRSGVQTSDQHARPQSLLSDFTTILRMDGSEMRRPSLCRHMAYVPPRNLANRSHIIGAEYLLWLLNCRDSRQPGVGGDLIMTSTACRLDPRKTGRAAEALEESLRRLVVGQDEAIRKIVDLYQMYVTGMTSLGRPIGNVLFLGPTGSGKTRLVEATAESLFGDANSIVKVNCAEFQHSHEIAKLIGAPPGYLGHRETHPVLSQEALNRPHTETVKISLVLFDEIEKASDALWNLLLGILDKATLSLGDGRQTDFSRAFIFMTSNLGAVEMEGLIRPRWGFATKPNGAGGEQVSKKLSCVGVEAARKKFTPEFINRLDAMVVFNALGEAELRHVVEIELRRVQQRVLHSKAAPFVFRVTEAAVDQLLVDGTDARYGARHLRRAIDRLLVQPISNLLATDQLRGGDCLVIDSDPGSHEMTFVREAEALSTLAMARLAQQPLLACSAQSVAHPEQPAPSGILRRFKAATDS
jgi:hypothetical protein